MKLENKTDKLLGIYILFVIIACISFLGFKAPGILVLMKAKKAIAISGFATETGMTNTQKIQCEIKYCEGVPCGCKAQGDDPMSKLCAMVDMAQCSLSLEIYGASVGGTNTKNALIISTIAEVKSGYKPGDSIIAGGTGELMTTVFADPGGCYGCSS